MKPNPKYLSFYYQTMTEFPDIELDPKKTALLIIDMQNEFVRRDMGEALQFKEMGWIISGQTICMLHMEELPACWITVKIAVQYRNPKDGTECCFR